MFVFSNELRNNIRGEIQQSKGALENAIGLSSDALQQANQVYDEALTLIANINGLSVPEINLEKLRTDAVNAIKEVMSLSGGFSHFMHSCNLNEVKFPHVSFLMK